MAILLTVAKVYNIYQFNILLGIFTEGKVFHSTSYVFFIKQSL